MQRSVRFIAILGGFLFYCNVRLGCRVCTFLKVHLQHVGVAHPKWKSEQCQLRASTAQRDSPLALGRHGQMKQLNFTADRLCGPGILHSRLNRILQEQTEHSAGGEQAKDGTNDQPEVEAGGCNEAEHA